MNRCPRAASNGGVKKAIFECVVPVVRESEPNFRDLRIWTAVVGETQMPVIRFGWEESPRTIMLLNVTQAYSYLSATSGSTWEARRAGV
jgi:hypothetical protein